MPPKFKRNISTEDFHSAEDAERVSKSRSEKWVDAISAQTAELLRDDSEDEDFFLRGPSKSKGVRYEDGKLMEVRAQVKEVEGVMRENIERVLDRGERLTDLQDKSESMATSAQYFSSSSKRLQKAVWWRDMKMKIILTVVIVIILLLIFVPIIVQQTKR